MKKVLLVLLALGAAAFVANEVPAMVRYLKIERM
jgi:hypothetical protein